MKSASSGRKSRYNLRALEVVGVTKNKQNTRRGADCQTEILLQSLMFQYGRECVSGDIKQFTTGIS